MENMGSGEHKNLINELTNGRELAKQLQIYLSASSSSRDTRELLVQKILTSYNNALSMLRRSGPLGEPQVPAAGGSGGGGGGGIGGMGISESPRSLSGSPRSEDSDKELDNRDGSRKRKTIPRWTRQVQVSPGPGLEGAFDDGFSWRKYGKKEILGAIYPRGYYKCSQRNAQGCLATKQVQRSDDDPTILEITYRGRHTCTQLVPHQIPAPPAALPENQEPIDHLQSQNKLLSFQTDLKVITEGLDSPNNHPFPPFSFTSPSNIKVENPGGFSSSMVMDDGIVNNFPTSFISPPASGSNYFSMSQDEMNRIGGNNQNLQGHDGGSGAGVGAGDINEIPRFEQFPFGSMEFDPNFNFDNQGFF